MPGIINRTFQSELSGTGHVECDLYDCGVRWMSANVRVRGTLSLLLWDWNHSASTTTLVSVWNTRVFWTALMALTEPRTLWRRITRYLSPRRRVALHSISKVYFSHWSERMWSVNLDASISGVSDPRRVFLLAFRVTGSADDKPWSTWECQRHVWEHLESQSCIQFVFSSMYLCIYVSI